VEALRKIAGYAHWIPITQGLHRDFFERNYPGWEWNDIIPVLLKKGILKVYSKEVDQRKLSQGLSISLEIESVTMTVSNKRIRVSITKKNLTTEDRS